MIPYIYTPFGNISTFIIAITVAMLLMLVSIHIILRKAKNREMEEIFIVPKIIASSLIALFSAAIFDAIFKVRENGVFRLSGITFYGGLIGATIGLYIILKISNGKTQYTTKEWFNKLTVPLIIFHFWGRIGCFFAGCCYGKVTDSFFGVYFPDNVENGIIHNGLKCYPTQLFEAVAILIILIIVINSRNRFEIYLILYAIARFLIELLRGDDRGYIISYLSPAQVISILILICVIIYKLIFKVRLKNVQ